MSFVEPQFTRGQVRRAGEVLSAENVDHIQLTEVMPVIVNWRAAHAYPLNTFQATLRRRLAGIGGRTAERSLVGERLKRLPSIEAKLRRQHGMKLERMQDIAGLRAVVPDMAALRKLREMYRDGALTHELKSIHDYVSSPKSDGYRSIHLVYRYRNNRKPAYDGLCVELQMRTRLQHAWATAVETVDIFANQSIKAGRPDPEWARFFRLASTAFSLQEGTPVHQDFEGISLAEISKELALAEERLDVIARLRGFRLAASSIHQNGRARAAYHLVVLNTSTHMVRVTPFSESKLAEANEAYAAVERFAASGGPFDPVLVAGGSVAQLRKTYPNYFLDAGVFIEKISRICEKKMPLPSAMRGRSPPHHAALVSAMRTAAAVVSYLPFEPIDSFSAGNGFYLPAYDSLDWRRPQGSANQATKEAVDWSSGEFDSWVEALLPPQPRSSARRLRAPFSLAILPFTAMSSAEFLDNSEVRDVSEFYVPRRGGR